MEVHGTLHAGLDGDTAAGVTVGEAEAADDEVSVLLNVSGEAGDVKCCYCGHNLLSFNWVYFFVR
jgi:hypothetical protein